LEKKNLIGAFGLSREKRDEGGSPFSSESVEKAGNCLRGGEKEFLLPLKKKKRKRKEGASVKLGKGSAK